MSRNELERLVEAAEADPGLREVLRSCHSQAELLLAARIRGFHITRVDLQRAWQEHRIEEPRQASGGGG